MKYKLTENTKEIDGITLYQIVATKDFNDVETGHLGGWVESESNLSHYGDAWVHGNATVFGNARVFGNAWVNGDARVFGEKLE
jgi:hypothetical protein